MKLVAKFLRASSKVRFSLLDHRTIKDIPTDDFNNILDTLSNSGWKKTYEYCGFDAWIDYGKVKLKNNGKKLIFEWDNWTEGSIEGYKDTINEIAKQFGLSSINEWRWSEYDEKT